VFAPRDAYRVGCNEVIVWLRRGLSDAIGDCKSARRLNEIQTELYRRHDRQFQCRWSARSHCFGMSSIQYRHDRGLNERSLKPGNGQPWLAALDEHDADHCFVLQRMRFARSLAYLRHCQPSRRESQAGSAILLTVGTVNPLPNAATVASSRKSAEMSSAVLQAINVSWVHNCLLPPVHKSCLQTVKTKHTWYTACIHVAPATVSKMRPSKRQSKQTLHVRTAI
jgi:hypothetical protein